MLDFSHLPTGWGSADVQEFIGKSDAITAGALWDTWLKPRGKSMCSIILIGNGANGGTGVVGANSVSAGGGGGGSGAATTLNIPMVLLPDVLYIGLNSGGNSASALGNYVSIAPPLTAGGGAPVASNVLAIAGGGSRGGNGAAGVAGALGGAGAAGTGPTMPLGWAWATSVGGHAGGAGGAAAAGGTITLPGTGVIVTGGTGGAGLGAAASAGAAGGAITGAGVFPTIAGGLGTAVATTPPGNGNPGCKPVQNLAYWMGGTGGGATHGTALTTGLVQSSGGDGERGCGGGGMGGALTGSTVGRIGKGGPAYCMIVCW